AESLQHGGEEGDVLEAVPASAAAQQLVLKGRQVEAHPAVEETVDRVPSHAQHVRALEGPQRLQGGGPLALVLQEVEIGVKVEFLAVPHVRGNAFAAARIPPPAPWSSRTRSPLGPEGSGFEPDRSACGGARLSGGRRGGGGRARPACR